METKNYKTLFFTIASVIYSVVGYAQETENANELDKKYSPNSASIFNNTQKKSGENFQTTETDVKNVIKFSPTLLLRQRVALVYERKIAENILFNIGVGKPFGNDVFQQAFFSLSSLDELGSALHPHSVLKQSTYWGSMPLASSGIKFYFSGTAFDEAYIDFNYRWERMDFLLNSIVDARRVDGENDVKFKMNAFNFGFGYTAITGSRNNFIHDFFINFGLKTFRYTTFDLITVKGTNGANEIVFKKTGNETKARIVPALNIGYSFGFGF